MKIKNENTYKIMYNMEFIKPGEVVDVPNEVAKLLLKQPGVIEYVSKEQVADLEKDNEKLKQELELEKAKNRATELGIKFNPNIKLDTLLKKINEFESVDNEKE